MGGTVRPEADAIKWDMGTKLLGSGAVDYDAVVAPKGRHGFLEDVASNDE
jgi:hypothetical protein